MKKSAAASLCVYSALHFLIDFTCAMLMFSRVKTDAGLWAHAMLLYNFFAFVMQLPFGIAADRLSRNSLVAAAGCAAVALSCFLGPFPLFAAVLAGIGNGLFHVGGGLDVLNGRGGKCAPAGIFVSPGALGLWLGTIFGSGGGFSFIPAAILAGTAAALPFALRGNSGGGKNAEFALPAKAGTAACAAALLFAVVCIRGFAGMIFSFDWKAELALPYILAVVLGKAAGGFAADAVGSRLTAAVSLSASAVLFLFSGSPAAGLAAVFLFNMTMPLTLTAAADALPGMKGLSFGLMTFGLFLGFLPVYFGLSSDSVILYSAAAAVSLALIVPGLILSKRAEKK